MPGLCKAATVQGIEEQGWSLTPGRYVGVQNRESNAWDFTSRLAELNEQFEELNSAAAVLQKRISTNVDRILRGV